MNSAHVTRIAEQLGKCLGEAEINRVGRETGFLKRLRQVTPFHLAVSLISALSSRTVETIADLRRSFCALTDRAVAYKPFHNQLAKEEFPVFMYGLFETLLERLAVRTLASVPGHVLSRFDDIVIQDGSSFGIHRALNLVFPGRFTDTSPAAVELHLTLGLFEGRPLRVSLAPDAQAERTFLPDPEELCGKLFLADRGYMDIDYCGRMQAAGACFIVRFSKSADPVVLGGWIDRSRVSPRTQGKRLKQWAGLLRGRDADLDVRWKRGAEIREFRLVLVWNPVSKEHMVLATNLTRADFPLQYVRDLYRLRWQVELVFKEWKSYANLKSYCTRKAPIAEGLIWAALCAAVLKRFLAHTAQSVSQGVEVSTRIAAMALDHHLPRLLHALLNGHEWRTELERLLEYLATTCQRAHPRRDRKSGRLATGLRPTRLNAAMATCVAKN